MRYVADDVAGKVHAALGQGRVSRRRARWTPAIASRLIGDAPADDGAAGVGEEDARRAGRKIAGKTDLPRIYAERDAAHGRASRDSSRSRCRSCASATSHRRPCRARSSARSAWSSRSAARSSRPSWSSLAHGYYGYLPTPRHHELGGYETWLGTNRLETESLVATILHLIVYEEEEVDD